MPAVLDRDKLLPGRALLDARYRRASSVGVVKSSAPNCDPLFDAPDRNVTCLVDAVLGADGKLLINCELEAAPRASSFDISEMPG